MTGPVANRRLAGLVAICAALGAPATVRAQDACRTCHERLLVPHLHDPVVSLRGSAHDTADLSCAACHGGDAAEPTARAHSTLKGFTARPTPHEVPDICGGCHADPARLGPAGTDLPRDQLAQYRRSGHGKALKAGNVKAATCESCHGAHDLRSSSDPASRIHPRKLADLCGACHSDRELMAGTGYPVGQPARWRRSVHGQGLLKRGNAESPTCNGCHGSHGGVSEVNDVEACGRCHEQQQRSFRRSPHAKLFDRLGFASCVDCHGSHDVTKAHAALVGVAQGSTCRRCHTEAQDKVFEVVRHLGEQRTKAEREAQRLEEHLSRASKTGALNERGRALSAELRKARSDLAESIHAMDDAGVDAAVRRIAAIADRASAPEETPPSRSGRWIAVAAVVGGIIVATIVLTLLGRNRRRRGGGRP